MNLELLKNSLALSAGATILAGFFGAGAALWTSTLRGAARQLMIALAIASLALPSFLQTNCWLELLGASGRWRGWLPLNIYSMGGAIWIIALLTWPIFFGFALSAWSRIEAAQIESDAALRGVSLGRFLLWPMARASLAQAALLVFVIALNNFTVPALLQVRVLPAQVWIQFEANLKPGAAFLKSIPLIAAPLLLVLFWRKGEMAWGADAQLPAKALRRQIGSGLLISSGFVTVIGLIASVGLPGWELLSARRTWVELGSVLAAVSSVAQNSFLFPALAGMACVAAGILIRRWRLGAVLWMPFFVPGVLLGIALISLANNRVFEPIYHSAAIIVIAWLIRYVAIGWQTASQAFRTVDRDQVDFARLSGASGWALFRHVQWPQIGPRLALAWYVIYLLCLWDVETLILILPPGCETLAVRIFGLLHYGHNSQVNALCLLLLGLAVAPLVAWHGIKYARQVVKGTTVALAAMLLLCGCNKPAEQSRLFGRIEIIGHRGAGAGEFHKPRSVAVDRSDNLYVVDMTGRVQKFSPEGQFLISWQMPQTDLGKPKGMCIDHDGNMVVVEPHYQRVNHFSPEGKLVEQWGRSGTNVGELTLPRSVAVNSRGDIFVSEYTRVDRVQGFSGKEKRPIMLIGRPGSDPGEFNRAEGLGIDREDRIYVADSCNHRVQVFGPDGKWLRSHGGPGKNPGEMSYPYDVRVDAEGRQYVCEFGNSRVQVFDANDKLLEVLGRPGAAPGEFGNPWSMALDSHGNLYVCDSGNHRVQKFIRR